MKYIIWTAIVGFELLILFGLYSYWHDMKHVEQGLREFYNATNRAFWSFFLALLILLCVNGHGGNLLYLFIIFILMETRFIQSGLRLLSIWS